MASHRHTCPAMASYGEHDWPWPGMSSYGRPWVDIARNNQQSAPWPVMAVQDQPLLARVRRSQPCFAMCSVVGALDPWPKLGAASWSRASLPRPECGFKIERIAKGELLKLKSSQGEIFEVEPEVACMSFRFFVCICSGMFSV